MIYKVKSKIKSFFICGHHPIIKDELCYYCHEVEKLNKKPID